jgi:hypothetical protein
VKFRNALMRDEDEFGENMAMNCEEFATAGLDLGSPEVDSVLQKAAREHLNECAHCSVLHENWLALRDDLRILGAETAAVEAPSRVEMRLRQEFRTRHKTFRSQKAALVISWGLAAAAALFCVISLANWRLQRGTNVAKLQGTKTSQGVPNVGAHSTPLGGSELGEVLVASNDSGDFTLLPDSMPLAPEDATVVRVQMQRATLGTLGLAVNEEHASDWIQVDLLVGDDGLPRAVRLPQMTTETTN